MHRSSASAASAMIVRMSDAFTIRAEEPRDRAEVLDVVRAAFTRHPDDVALLVERLQPELSLVAVDGADVVGHIILSWVTVLDAARPRLLCLSPLAVRPERQRQGIGAALTREALARAEAAGEPAVIVEGIPAYYPQFGFERATALGFVAPSPTIPDEAFMVKRLPGFTPELAGRIVYPAAFDHL
jgi:putative acetyltransferase